MHNYHSYYIIQLNSMWLTIYICYRHKIQLSLKPDVLTLDWISYSRCMMHVGAISYLKRIGEFLLQRKIIMKQSGSVTIIDYYCLYQHNIFRSRWEPLFQESSTKVNGIDGNAKQMLSVMMLGISIQWVCISDHSSCDVWQWR